MFAALIKRLDALFYQTIVTTTTVTHRRYLGNDLMAIRKELYGQGIRTICVDGIDCFIQSDGSIISQQSEVENGFIKNEVTVSVTKTNVVVDGKAIALPQAVKTMPPLRIDGVYNFASFPNYLEDEFTISYCDDKKRFVSYRGEPLTRSRSIGRWTRNAVMTLHTDISTKLIKDESISISKSTIGPMTISLAVHEQWFHATVLSDDGGVMQVHLDNSGQLRSEAECITLGFALARATCLTYGALQFDVDPSEEIAIAQSFIALIFNMRE